MLLEKMLSIISSSVNQPKSSPNFTDCVISQFNANVGPVLNITKPSDDNSVCSKQQQQQESNSDDVNYQVRSWCHSSIAAPIKIYKSRYELHWCIMSPSLNRLFGKQTNFFYHGKEFDDQKFKQFVNKHEHTENNIQGKRPKPVNVQFILDSNFIGVLEKTKNQLVNQFLSWVSENATRENATKSSEYDVIELV